MMFMQTIADVFYALRLIVLDYIVQYFHLLLFSFIHFNYLRLNITHIKKNSLIMTKRKTRGSYIENDEGTCGTDLQKTKRSRGKTTGAKKVLLDDQSVVNSLGNVKISFGIWSTFDFS